MKVFTQLDLDIEHIEEATAPWTFLNVFTQLDLYISRIELGVYISHIEFDVYIKSLTDFLESFGWLG